MNAELPSAEHVPVMLQEALRLLGPQPGEIIADGTLGAGGHAEAVLNVLSDTGRLIGLDRDPEMAERTGERLAKQFGERVKVLCANFSDMDEVFASLSLAGADGILLDLGVASPHLDCAERGFSYRTDGPLDMRMDPDRPTAEEWINRAREEEIADVLYQYGEERRSRRIARAIVRARARGAIRRTVELAEIIRRAMPPGPRKLHPARRSFQAIRIFLNREMEHLDIFLEKLPGLLRPNGRCVIISYHSLEDRRVKNAFRDGAREETYAALTRKPLRPAPEEVRANPRSRSARLRAVRRAGQGEDS
jgi:16S rRNA (cytosine1402-N4)-methyltransferase